MKTSTVLGSLLFGTLALAAPVDKRALVYKTEVVVETVVVYTTVWDTTSSAASSTTSDGAFYQQPTTTSSAVVAAVSSAAPAYTPAASSAVESSSSSIYTPPVETPTSTSTSTSIYTPTPTPTPSPEPETSSEAPAPTSTEPAYTPPASSTAAAATTAASTSSTTTGETFSDVDLTIYDNSGGYGACGTKIYDSDMVVALAKDAWGASTYDVQTGAATNPWCGQKIKVDYNGNSIEATIMDMCPGCSGHDIDLSLAAYTKLTGLSEKTRLKASWSKIS